MKKNIGVLCLQGAYMKHIEMLKAVGANPIQVINLEDTQNIQGLILPGGESTTISKMMVKNGLIAPLRRLIDDGLPVYGTCAGLIMLADRLTEDDSMNRLKGLAVTVKRNAYGRQIDSFEATLNLDIDAPEFHKKPFDGIFIRAPQIVPGSCKNSVQVLCTFEDIPVLVRQNNILAGSFHPELTGDERLHAWFVHEL